MSLPPFVPSHPRDWTDLTSARSAPAQPAEAGILGPSSLHSAAPAAAPRATARTNDLPVSDLGTARGMRSNRPSAAPRR